MKLKKFTFFVLTSILFLGIFASKISAEEKIPSGGIIPKLPKTENDPELFNGHVYPEWGPICQRYTYSTIYRDKEGRPPEYVKIYFNGEMIDMDPASPKASAGKEDYQKGVLYEYKYVPKKIGSNFYYFEASNGLGKTRDSIIDSPDNGPVLFESAFDKNEIVLIDPFASSEQESVIWRYSTDKEWIGGVALSDDGQYLAAQTSQHVYLFSTESNKPLWEYRFNQPSPIGGGPRGNGIDISGDGSKIIASVGTKTILFGSQNNQPIWEYQSPTLAVAISQDGQYAAASSVKQGQGEMSNVLLLWQTDNPEPIWKFSGNSNFHDVSLSSDGQYLAASTGCPDRKAYIFSKESQKPLVQSERLTLDSPVSKSKISADGSLAAFATEGGPDSSVVVLFSNNSNQPLWKFDNQKRNSSRALSLTSDGLFAAAATMQGDVYLLGTENNLPLKSWSLNTSIGALGLAEDGSFLALGGTDRQVHLLPREGNAKKISVNEFIQAIDISANGRYVAAGTGGSVYFFEDYLTPNKDKIFKCETIIEPSPMTGAMELYDGGSESKDKRISERIEKNFLPTFLEGLTIAGALALIYGLLFYFAKKISPIHWVLIAKIPRIFWIAGAIFFAILGATTLTTYQPFFSWPSLVHLVEAVFGFGYLASLFKDKKRLFFLGGVVLLLFLAHLSYQIWESGDSEQPVSATGEGVCGNSLCEPDLGESKENCPQDCSAGF